MSSATVKWHLGVRFMIGLRPESRIGVLNGRILPASLAVDWDTRCIVALVARRKDTNDWVLKTAEGILAGVRDVQEAILVLVLFVDGRHECCCGRENLIDKDEDGLLGCKLDTLADDVDELTNSQIRWYEVLLLVDGGDIGAVCFFADDGDAIRILLADAVRLGLALLKRVLVLEC